MRGDILLYHLKDVGDISSCFRVYVNIALDSMVAESDEANVLEVT